MRCSIDLGQTTKEGTGQQRTQKTQSGRKQSTQSGYDHCGVYFALFASFCKIPLNRNGIGKFIFTRLLKEPIGEDP